ncbi:MAG: sulfotransferase [Cyclobacteriaceae bacterium]
MHKRTRPILVTGIYRSGSTWLGKMISQAPNVKYYGEPFNPINSRVYGIKFPIPFYRLSQKDDIILQKLKNAVGINKDVETLISRLAINDGFFNNIVKLYRYQDALIKGSNAVPLIKDPFALFSADTLAQKLDCRVVVIIRHPAAFVHSVQRMNWGFNFNWFLSQTRLMDDLISPFEEELIARKKKGYNKSVTESTCLIWSIFHYVINHYQNENKNWVFVRHEDLSFEPLAQYKLIFDGLGLIMTDRVIDAIVSSSNSSNQVEASPNQAFELKRDSKANIQTWKNHLAKSEIDLIRERTEEISRLWYSESDW